MVVYFSGTGNSRFCAQGLAQSLGDELRDAFHFIRDGVAAELHSEKPWVFVTPTYAWRLPRVFEGFLRGGSFQGSRDAYFVLTCGSEIGNAGGRLQRLCGEKGFRYRGVLQVVMPENYIALFNAPEGAAAKKIVDAARPLLAAGADRVLAGEDFPAPKCGPLDRLKSGPVNAAFYRFIIKAGPFTVSEDCVSCGKCAAACVLRNITLKDGKPIWGKNCTHCMACICGCPTAAIEYGRASRGKPRYQCPEYE